MIALYHGSVQKNKAIYDTTIASVKALSPDDTLITTDSFGVCFWAACAGINMGLKTVVLGAGQKPRNAVDCYREDATNLVYKQVGAKDLPTDYQLWLLSWAKEHNRLKELDEIYTDEVMLQWGFRRQQDAKLHLITDGINWRTYRLYVRCLQSKFPMAYLLGEPSDEITPITQLL